jgi:AraC-like DNA-binding protein
VFGRTLLKIDIDPLSDAFQAEARAKSWPGFGMIHASTSAVHQANSSQLISSDNLSFGKVSFMAASGRRWRAAQLGREAELSAGDGVLMSNEDIGSITLMDDCRYQTFAIPAAPLAALVPDMTDWFARGLPGDSPAMRLLSGYLRLARDEQCLATPELRNAFARHVVDLLALAIGATRDAAELAKSRGGRAARLAEIKQDIDNALQRPELSVGSIAARNNVTPRYVQLLFEESGTTFTQYVLERRLQAACSALTDAARMTAPISAIAYASGFADLSNFNRAFRKRFGCTPSDIRGGGRNDVTPPATSGSAAPLDTDQPRRLPGAAASPELPTAG